MCLWGEGRVTQHARYTHTQTITSKRVIFVLTVNVVVVFD